MFWWAGLGGLLGSCSGGLEDSGVTGSSDTGGVDSGADSATDSAVDTEPIVETGSRDSGDTSDTADTGVACWGPNLVSPGVHLLEELEGEFYSYSAIKHGRRGDIDGDGRLDLFWAGGSYLNGNRGPICGEFDAWEDPEIWYSHDPTVIGFAAYDFEAEDVDGDGVSDLLAGSGHIERDDGLLGEYYLILGPHDTRGRDVSPERVADATFVHSSEKVWYESAILDANADGTQDFVIQYIAHLDDDYAPNTIISGPVAGLVDVADGGFATIHGESNDIIDNLRSWGDVDGDGFDDLFVGSSYSVSRAGSVGLFLGPLAGEHDWTDADTLVYGHTAYQGVGYSLSSGRDANGDGYTELLIGGRHGGTPGSAFLVLGPLTRSGRLDQVAAMEVVPIAGDGELGDAVSLEQDLDGDGYADLAIGAPESHLHPKETDRPGGAMIWFGPPPEGRVTREDAEVLLVSNERYDGDAGDSVFSPGDINEDGYEDLIIGARHYHYSNLLLGGPR